MSVLSEFKKYFLVQEQKHEQLLKQWREQIEIDNAVKALKLSISNKDIDLDLAEKVVGASKYTTNFMIQKYISTIRELEGLLSQLKKQDITLNVEDVLNNVSNDKLDKNQFMTNLKVILDLSALNFTDDRLKAQITKKQEELIEILEDIINKYKDELSVTISRSVDFFLTKRSSTIYREKTNTEEYLKSIRLFTTFFDENQVLKTFPNKEVMNEFFLEIKRSRLTEEEKLELIKIFTKVNLKSYLEKKKIADTSVTAIVNVNKKNVHEILARKASKKNKPTLEETSKAPKKAEVKLTDEAKKLYDGLKQILELYSAEIDLEDIELLALENNFEVNARTNYTINEMVNWKLIVSDIEHNLLPNISKHTEEIKKIYEYILDLKEKEDVRKKEHEEYVKRLTELLNNIQQILNENSKILAEYDSLDASKKNTYNSIMKLITEDLDEEQIKQNIEITTKSKNITWFKKLIILKELREDVELMQDLISLEYISEENLQMINELEKFILIEKEKLSTLPEEKEKVVLPQKEDENTEFEDSKNLIIFNIKDDVSSYSDEFKSELNSTLYKLRNEKWDILRRRSHFISPVRYNTKSGAQKEYDELFEPYRVKNSHTTRTGVIKIKICKENVLKIRKRYALKNELNSLFIITGVIGTSGNDHSNYKQFNEYIENNYDYLNYVSVLFNNPNADENELFKIIDENCSLRLNSNQYGGGN